MWLSCHGRVRADDPEGYRPVQPWVPIDSLAPEGAWVEAGDELFALNRTLAQNDSDERQRQISLAESVRERDRLSSAGKIEDLKLRKAALEKQVEVLDARIAATQQRDEEELRIAELEVKAARSAVDAAQRRVDRLEPLHASGIISDRKWRDAGTALARAGQALRLPETRLEVLQESTYATTRYRLQLERAIAAAELGDATHGGGVFGDIEAQWDELKLGRRMTNRRLRRLYVREKRAAKLLSNNVVRASQAGVVRHRAAGEGALRVGSRPRNESTMYVLRDGDMCFSIDVPERWRDVQSLPGGTNGSPAAVRIDVPGLRVSHVQARVVSTSVLPLESRIPGRRHYVCRIVPAVPLEGLTVGMQVTCRFPVRLPEGAVIVPSWCVADVGGNAHVTMEGGERREMVGQRIGESFVVHAGLQLGERIQGRPARDGRPATPFKGRIRATRVQDLNVPRRVEILDMVAEGTSVRKGDVVATCVSTSWRATDHEAEAKEHQDVARAQLAVDRVRAESEMVRKYVAWRQADLSLRKARLEHRVERYARNDEEQTSGDTALERAKLDLQAAVAVRAERRAQIDTGTVSAQRLRAAELSVQLAESRLAIAEIKRIDMYRRRSWLTVWRAEGAAREAEEAALTARSDFSVGRATQNLELRQAAEKYQNEMDRARRHIRELEALIVRAPFDGEVYYNRDGGHAILETGRPLSTTVPFHMPIGKEKEAVVELPARLYGRLNPGDEVEVVVPALGPTPVSGRVRHVSRHFHGSEDSLTDQLLGEVVGTPPVVFTVTIQLPADDRVNAIVKPGMNAWIGVSS